MTRVRTRPGPDPDPDRTSTGESDLGPGRSRSSPFGRGSHPFHGLGDQVWSCCEVDPDEPAPGGGPLGRVGPVEPEPGGDADPALTQEERGWIDLFLGPQPHREFADMGADFDFDDNAEMHARLPNLARLFKP